MALYKFIYLLTYLHVWMHSDAFLFPVLQRKGNEKKTSAKIYLKEKSLDPFDQFINMTEREPNSRGRYDTVCVILCLNCIGAYIVYLYKFIYVC